MQHKYKHVILLVGDDMKTITIGTNDAGQRLDKFLIKLSQIYQNLCYIKAYEKKILNAMENDVKFLHIYRSTIP